MHTNEVEERSKRLAELLGRDEDPNEAEQKEAIKIGLELLGGACHNLARIADALDHGVVATRVVANP